VDTEPAIRLGCVATAAGEDPLRGVELRDHPRDLETALLGHLQLADGVLRVPSRTRASASRPLAAMAASNPRSRNARERRSRHVASSSRTRIVGASSFDAMRALRCVDEGLLELEAQAGGDHGPLVWTPFRAVAKGSRPRRWQRWVGDVGRGAPLDDAAGRAPVAHAHGPRRLRSVHA
jgi:hypothetical protein